MKPIISIAHVMAGYDGKTVLRDVSLDVFERDFLGIIGPNGGGKTTLVRILLGLMKPRSGTVSYFRDGSPVDTLTMGYLPQYTAIDRKFPISVYEVVLSGLTRQKRFLRPYTQAQHAQVRETLHEMELDGLERRPIGTLSGGQLQRVLLSRAIVSHPEVVVLDEPDTYIDKRSQDQMYRMLTRINSRCAIIMVSHDVGMVLQSVKNVACVNETLHYHPSMEIDSTWIEEHFGCPMELLTHGDMPHRVLKKHSD